MNVNRVSEKIPKAGSRLPGLKLGVSVVDVRNSIVTTEEKRMLWRKFRPKGSPLSGDSVVPPKIVDGMVVSPGSCSKCGNDRLSGPTFETMAAALYPSFVGVMQHLVWRCVRCGAGICTPCLDAMEKEGGNE